jgi:uncharacterized membrane protein
MLGAVLFWVLVALPYLSLDYERFGEAPEFFWPRRYELLVHIAGGSLALLVGPIQLWLGHAGRHMDWHRLLGKLYLAGVLVGSVAAYYLVFTSTLPFGWIYLSGLFSLTVAWNVTTGMAYVAIRRGAIEQHREWMVRSYVVTFAFVLFRVLILLFDGLEIGVTPERFAAAAWLAWAVPLMLTEPLLQLRKLRSAPAEIR